MNGDLYAAISILVIMVRHFQEEGGLTLPDLPKAVKVDLRNIKLAPGHSAQGGDEERWVAV